MLTSFINFCCCISEYYDSVDSIETMNLQSTLILVVHSGSLFDHFLNDYVSLEQSQYIQNFKIFIESNKCNYEMYWFFHFVYYFFRPSRVWFYIRYWMKTFCSSSFQMISIFDWLYIATILFTKHVQSLILIAFWPRQQIKQK